MSVAESTKTGADFLKGGGEMGALMRSIDWSKTPIGPVDNWPQSLKTSVSTCLNSRFPILLWWGPEIVMLYNDAYRTILGTEKHPMAMGAAGQTVWPEIWDIVGPMLKGVMERAEATWSEDFLLTLERNGYPEECYFTFSYSPIRDESGDVGGIFTAVHETTEKVLGERRLRTLRDLAAHGSKAKSVEHAYRAAIQTITGNEADVSFAFLYLLDEETDDLVLVGKTPEAASELPGWPLSKAIDSGQAIVVNDLKEKFGELPKGSWAFPPTQALVLPLRAAGNEKPAGALIVGLTSGRALDTEYQSFVELVAEHTATAISNARAYEAERKRAEALAEIDRAKTTFFSNVSHEFRTPLTLMLGPLENVLARPEELPRESAEELRMVHRNSLRLLRLVNTLLDFSRIQAGRVDASYEATDISHYTAELASSFRSAIEAAGLRLIIDCPPLKHPVFIDHVMWEKIVLNLISNAFKFTHNGEVAVKVREHEGYAELTIRDTGTGIPEEELPRLFERFYRVEGSQGRTHEGTGIGLSLVQELALIHGGDVRVSSKLGEGSTFTVTVPLGSGHLPQEKIHVGPTVAKGQSEPNAYVEEAKGWLGAAIANDLESADLPSGAASRPFVLLADDNADLRNYITHILERSAEVVAVSDGEEALEVIRARRPDILLSDVMMPKLDGLGLVKILRKDPATASIPVILLSARVGNEASQEGFEAGADDYLTKPFTANELVARVSSHIRLSELRHDAQRQLREKIEELETLLDVIPVGIGISEDKICCEVRANPVLAKLLRLSPGDNASKTAPVGERPTHFKVLDASGNEIADDMLPMQIAAKEGVDVKDLELNVAFPDGEVLTLLEYAAPLLDEEGNPRGCVGAFVDITAIRQAEQAVRVERERLAGLLMSAPAIICVLRGPRHMYELTNANYMRLIGKDPSENILGKSVSEVIPEMISQGYVDLLDTVYQTGVAYFGSESRVVFRSAEDSAPKEHFVNFVFQPTKDISGNVDGVLVHSVDVTEQVNARLITEEIARDLSAERDRLRFMAESMPVKIFTTHPNGVNSYANQQFLDYCGLTQEELKHWEWSNLTHPDELERNLKAWQHAIETGEPLYLEQRLRRVDGEYRWHISRAYAMRNEQNEITMWIGSIADIEDRKQAEELHREQLEQEVRLRTEELLLSNEQLQGFTYSVAHDLRQQIRGISSNASLLLLDAGEDISEETRETLQRLTGSSKRLATLVDDLLNYARLGRQQPRVVTLDLSALALEVSAFLKQNGACDDETVFRIQPDLEADGDPAMMRLVLENLMDNACKYSRDSNPPTVEIGRSGEEFYVRDNGVGFEMDFVGKLFQPFERLHLGSDYSGTGIGLANVKRIIERHGGTVRAEGEPGKGATFYFTLGD